MKLLYIQPQSSIRSAVILAIGVLTSSALADTAQTQALLKQATTGEAQARYTAIDDLGERAADPELVIPELVKMLSVKDPQVDWRSARAIGDYGDAAISAAPALRELLGKSDPVLEYHAAIALGKIGDKSDETVDALVKAIGSSDMRVSRAAIKAIKNLRPGPQKTVPALKKALATGDPAVAGQALDAVVEQGANAVPFINEALKEPSTAYLAAAAAEQIGPDAAGAVPALVKLLDATQNSQLDIRVLLALGRIGPAAKSAAPQITEVLETSTDATVPVAAAFALGAIGATEADAPLRAAAAKDNEFLAMVATWSLAKLHPEDAQLKSQAMDKLKAGMESADPGIKAAAEKGLEMMETRAAAPAK
jgi:HEAT repeat protein